MKFIGWYCNEPKMMGYEYPMLNLYKDGLLVQQVDAKMVYKLNNHLLFTGLDRWVLYKKSCVWNEEEKGFNIIIGEELNFIIPSVQMGIIIIDLTKMKNPYYHQMYEIIFPPEVEDFIKEKKEGILSIDNPKLKIKANIEILIAPLFEIYDTEEIKKNKLQYWSNLTGLSIKTLKKYIP